jgi:hypothetical protein
MVELGGWGAGSTGRHGALLDSPSGSRLPLSGLHEDSSTDPPRASMLGGNLLFVLNNYFWRGILRRN